MAMIKYSNAAPANKVNRNTWGAVKKASIEHEQEKQVSEEELEKEKES
jgi:hypothetical protein